MCAVKMRVVVLLCACVAMLALLVDGEKRSDLSPVPFVMGSRYGRSSPRLIAPRNDRFFMGSRYGKRSSSDADTLWCEYTGVHPLYRCLAQKPNYDKRSETSDETERGEQE